MRVKVPRIPRHLRTVGWMVGFAVLLGYHCAHQVAPSGGPIDKIPPRVKSTIPAQGEVAVDRRLKIILRFSEWIDPASVSKSVTIFPPIDKGFRTVVRGTELRIEPLSSLLDSTTYHVEINTNLQDLHGISIGTPFHLVFSTGMTLDSGMVSGCIVDPFGLAGQPKVGLYRFPFDSAAPESLLFGMPSYLVQVDSIGKFVLEHVRPGLYQVIGFVDRNNDNRFQPGEGNAFAPYEPQTVVLSNSRLWLELEPTRCDTSAYRIVSVKALSPVVVVVQWALPPPEEADAFRREAWHVETADTVTIRPLTINRVIPIGRSNRYVLLLADSLRLRSYRLICPRFQPRRNALVMADSDTLLFNGVISPDTLRPVVTVLRVLPETGLQPLIRLVFSEPVRLTDGRVWWIRDVDGNDSIAAIADTLLTDTVVVKPQQRLAPGREYVLRFPIKAFEDMAGNHPVGRDSTDSLNISFSTIEEDKICIRMAGSIACSTFAWEENRRWLFTTFGATASFVVRDSAGTFCFDSIPAAKGRLTLFVDLNGDGELTEGNLCPWQPPEPFILFGDTVEARARWEVSNIVLTRCNRCARFATPAKGAPASPQGSPVYEAERGRPFQPPRIPIGR